MSDLAVDPFRLATLLALAHSRLCAFLAPCQPYASASISAHLFARDSKGRARAGEARVARNVTVVRHRAEKAHEELMALVMTRERGRSLFIDFEPSPKARVLSLELAELRAGPCLLARDLCMSVARHQRVHLCGGNGAGKTTFIEALRARAAIPPDKLLYLPQDIDRAAGTATRDRIADLPGDQRGRVLELAAALGMDPERVASSASPSPGETRKLLLASGLALQPWVLLLDEPTNHLDLPSIERLEHALGDYPGAMVLISHDTRFAAPLTDTIWALAHEQLVTCERGHPGKSPATPPAT